MAARSNAVVTEQTDRELIIERVFDAPRELVRTVAPAHPVAAGAPSPLVIHPTAMHAAPLAIPAPADLGFTTLYVRSLIAFNRGTGAIVHQRQLPAARHAVVDLAQLINAQYDPSAPERLNAEQLANFRQTLLQHGLRPRDPAKSEEKLTHLRSLYEPYALAMARALFIELPPWMHAEKKKDNWEAGPWDRAIQAKSLASLGHAERLRAIDDHF